MSFIVYLFAVLKNIIYGSSIFFTGKLTRNVDVLDILALRFLMSFGIMFLLKITKVINIDISFKDFSKKSSKSDAITALLLASFFEPVLYMIFETTGISMTTNITASVILSLLPISSAIAEYVFLKEKITFQKGVFLTIGMVGAIFIAVNTQTKNGTDSLTGIMFVVLAVIVGSLFAVFSRKSSVVFNAMEITYFSCLMGAVIFNFANIVRHLLNGSMGTYFTPYMNVDNMVGFVFLAIISTIVATSMNNFALARMRVTTMSAFGGLGTLTAIVEGVLFNNEKLYMYHVVGISLILIRIIGMICLTSGENKKYTADFSVHK